MDLYIYPIQENPTQDQLNTFRKLIVDSLIAAETWVRLERRFTIRENLYAYLFTHRENQYQNEPFYLWYSKDSIKVNFEVSQNEGTKSMIIGMLVYYLRYHVSDQIRKIEII